MTTSEDEGEVDQDGGESQMGFSLTCNIFIFYKEKVLVQCLCK